MNTINTTIARTQIGKYIDEISSGVSKVFVFGRRNIPEAVLIPFPKHFNKSLSDISNVNMYGGAFDFLYDEPDLYSLKDLKTKQDKVKNVKK
jgi:antitoxin (DNA-binding transcriptional repressor) of toxin-antitoxin stability system